MTSNWPLRRILFWFVVIAVFFWIVRNPSHAAGVASGVFTTVMGWGQSAVSAVATFIGNLT